MSVALRVDFNYCSVEVGIGHALNWNETHFSPQQGREGEWRVKRERERERETGYCILIEPSSGTKFSQNCRRGWQEREAARFLTSRRRKKKKKNPSKIPKVFVLKWNRKLSALEFNYLYLPSPPEIDPQWPGFLQMHTEGPTKSVSAGGFKQRAKCVD